MHALLAVAVGLIVSVTFLAFIGSGRAVVGVLRRSAPHSARLLTVLGVTSVLVVGVADAALASTSSNTGLVYRTATYECTQAHVYINNTTASPHIDSQTTSLVANHGALTGDYTACANDYNLAAGLIVDREVTLKFNGPTGQWQACTDSGNSYNKTTAAHSSLNQNYAHPCGTGYYEGETGAYIYNNGWQGGWITTPGSVYVA